MGLLSKMIQEGALEVETSETPDLKVEEPKVEPKIEQPKSEKSTDIDFDVQLWQVGFPQHITITHLETVKEYKFFDFDKKVFGSIYDLTIKMDLGQYPRYYFNAIAKFLDLWSYWLSRIFDCWHQECLTIGRLYEAEQLFWDTWDSMFMVDDPMRIGSITVDECSALALRAITPPLKDWLPASFLSGSPFTRVMEHPTSSYVVF